ncbi:hypothetical protein TNCV_4020471 [Trichonephila clavipes]|nr:hypothetical protein TNCV_4020471 [Trichonephila clavipes]
MTLRRFRRQYKQLSQFEKMKIIGMSKAGWSARRVARQLGRFDCVVRRLHLRYGPLRLLEPYEDVWLKDITRVDLDIHPPTPPFGVVSRTRKLECSGMKPGRL